MQLPANAPGKAAVDGPSAGAPAPCGNEAPGSWLVGAIQGMNQWMEDLHLSNSLAF